jgi:hypothetical protein
MQVTGLLSYTLNLRVLHPLEGQPLVLITNFNLFQRINHILAHFRKQFCTLIRTSGRERAANDESFFRQNLLK